MYHLYCISVHGTNRNLVHGQESLIIRHWPCEQCRKFIHYCHWQLRKAWHWDEVKNFHSAFTSFSMSSVKQGFLPCVTVSRRSGQSITPVYTSSRSKHIMPHPNGMSVVDRHSPFLLGAVRISGIRRFVYIANSVLCTPKNHNLANIMSCTEYLGA